MHSLLQKLLDPTKTKTFIMSSSDNSRPTTLRERNEKIRQFMELCASNRRNDEIKSKIEASLVADKDNKTIVFSSKELNEHVDDSKQLVDSLVVEEEISTQKSHNSKTFDNTNGKEVSTCGDCMIGASQCGSHVDCDSESTVCSSITSGILSQNNRKPRSSEFTLRTTALQRPIYSMFNNFKCPPSCRLGQNCQAKISLMAILEELKSFWGDSNLELTTSTRRHTIITNLLAAYHRSTKSSSDEASSQFAFNVGASIGHDHRVCEQTYLHVIGHEVTRLWRKCRVNVQKLMDSGQFDNLNQKGGFVDRVEEAMNQTKDPTEQKSREQSESSKQFIQWFGNLNGSKSPYDGEDNLTILPFDTLAQLYLEYCFHTEKEKTTQASKTTFGNVYKALKKQGLYRFARGKGTFPTCDICNNANDLLSDKTMSIEVRELIVQLKVELIINLKQLFYKYDNLIILHCVLATTSKTTIWRTCCA